MALDEFEDEVHGYCTFPKQMPPPPGVADKTPIDAITTGRKGHGFTGAKYVNLAGMTQQTLDAWVHSIRFSQTPQGVAVTSVNQLGRDLLEAFAVPEGSKIVGVNRLLTRIDRHTATAPRH